MVRDPLSASAPPSTIHHPPSSNAPPRPGYVELPYTLPQDSTLFLLFREPSPEIWLRKLDWVAQHGGMALVNVHPDYVRFPGQPATDRTFPVEFYTQLLEHVRHRYAGRSWNSLPRAVAGFVKTSRPVPERRPRRRVCIISHSVYKSDGRVSRYGRALVERGDAVDVLGITADPAAPDQEAVDGARVFRVQTRRFQEKSKFSYLLPLLRFLWVASWRMARLHARQPYDLIHVHNVPDFLVFTAWRPKLGGAKVILDIHDLVPEFFTSKFATNHTSLLVRSLKLMERASAAFADHVIIANHLWLDKYASRSASPEKCSVLINFVDHSIFSPQPRTRDDGKLLILFPGSLQWHQGLDIAIRAFDLLKDRLPRAELHIYGEGSQKPELLRLTRELGLQERVLFPDALPIRDIARIMADADLGIVPKRADSFGNEAYSTKIMEFMAVGVPVVVSRTKIDRYYFNDSVVRFFESGNHTAMAEAMFEVLTDLELRARLVAQGLEFASANTWESRQGDYLRLVDSLCTGVKVRQEAASPRPELPVEVPVPR